MNITPEFIVAVISLGLNVFIVPLYKLVDKVRGEIADLRLVMFRDFVSKADLHNFQRGND